MNRIASMAVLVCAGLTFTQPAFALGTVGERIAWACTNDSDLGDDFIDEALEKCGATAGSKSACTTISGDPWTCNQPNGPTDADDSICDGSSQKVTINSEISWAGWKISAGAEGTLSDEAVFEERKTCSATPVTPTPTGPAGSYASESGKVKAQAKFEVTGAFTITTPAQISVTVNGGASCLAVRKKDAYKESDTAACEEVKQTDPRETETGGDAETQSEGTDGQTSDGDR